MLYIYYISYDLSLVNVMGYFLFDRKFQLNLKKNQINLVRLKFGIFQILENKCSFHQNCNKVISHTDVLRFYLSKFFNLIYTRVSIPVFIIESLEDSKSVIVRFSFTSSNDHYLFLKNLTLTILNSVSHSIMF